MPERCYLYSFEQKKLIIAESHGDGLRDEIIYQGNNGSQSVTCKCIGFSRDLLKIFVEENFYDELVRVGINKIIL